MWEWIKFSFRVWFGYLTAQIIIAIGIGFVVLFLLVVSNLIAFLAG